MTEHAELARLATALRHHVQRARRRGHRRSVAPPEPLPVPAAAAAPAPAAGSGAPPVAPGGELPARPRATGPAAPVAAPSRVGDVDPGELGWEELAAAVAGCTACPLHATRTQTVFADGAAPARVMFVGEAPGQHEDQRGVPFVGPAGAMLTDIITKGMGLRREDVVIANVLKCRPPENRDPTAQEKATCTPWLDRQIELVQPDVLIALGRHAAGHLLQSDAPMAKLRGRVHRRGGRRIVATYHPAYLLRSPHMKKACWEDIQLAMKELGLGLPGQR